MRGTGMRERQIRVDGSYIHVRKTALPGHNRKRTNPPNSSDRGGNLGITIGTGGDYVLFASHVERETDAIKRIPQHVEPWAVPAVHESYRCTIARLHFERTRRWLLRASR